jgi:hypothetical protein
VPECRGRPQGGSPRPRRPGELNVPAAVGLNTREPRDKQWVLPAALHGGYHPKTGSTGTVRSMRSSGSRFENWDLIAGPLTIVSLAGFNSGLGELDG